MRTIFNYQIDIRQIKYLNNTVEQDYRVIKKIIKAMKAFKSLGCAEATITGIELNHMLKNGQHSQPANMIFFEQLKKNCSISAPRIAAAVI